MSSKDENRKILRDRKILSLRIRRLSFRAERGILSFDLEQAPLRNLCLFGIIGAEFGSKA